jgi:adenine-specific DNA-methyltransferase
LAIVAADAVLPIDGLEVEDPAYLSQQLVTYIGNKRSLLTPIERAVDQVRSQVGGRLRMLDAFSGSGVVARLFKTYASHLVANDLEPYSRVLNECYLANSNDVPMDQIIKLVAELNDIVDCAQSTGGFVERLYAPEDDDNIRAGERVFYTRDNARRLDHYAQLINEVDKNVRCFLLGPLLSAASVHANTAGVFKGFYKDRGTGVGRFGGAGQDALSRIKGQIRLRPPILSAYRSELEVHQSHANDLVRDIEPVDLAYFDPPYNQHPYGSNYFMLNLLVDYREPQVTSSVSGIPIDWQRSGYNVKKQSSGLMADLIAATKARFLLISFNDEGYIAPDDMAKMLNEVGRVTEYKTVYNAFRGSRNLANRATHVTEHLYLVEKEV